MYMYTQTYRHMYMHAKNQAETSKAGTALKFYCTSTGRKVLPPQETRAASRPASGSEPKVLGDAASGSVGLHAPWVLSFRI